MDNKSGWRVETCDGPSGCVNRIIDVDPLVSAVGEVLARRLPAPEGRRPFLVSVSSCPNACSRPQIADFGVIGSSAPELTSEACILCMACVHACREGAVTVPKILPIIDPLRCVSCGQCARVCVPGTIVEGKRGFRVQLGGKLGRHPHLGEELSGVYAADGVLGILECCLDLRALHGSAGERFGETLERTGLDPLYSCMSERRVKPVEAPTGQRERRRVTRGPAR